MKKALNCSQNLLHTLLRVPEGSRPGLCLVPERSGEDSVWSQGWAGISTRAELLNQGIFISDNQWYHRGDAICTFSICPF